MNFFKHIYKTMGFDYRSLALYRFLLGFIVIADVVYRIEDLVNFYTDAGLVPRALFMNEMSMPWSVSFHFANGTTTFAIVMFAVQFLIGIMIALGLKTRWAVFGAYVFAVSVHNRNWLVNNGGDDILRAILFISIFLPLNRCFSLDSALRRDKRPTQELHHSTWGLMYFFQVFAIYFVSYLLKDHPMWRSDFTAVYYATRLDIFATPLSYWLRNFPIFQTATTIFTIWLEFLGPLLLVFSFVFGRFWWVARLAVIVLFWMLHFGIIATMWIGVFPWTCLVMFLIFLPTPFWEKIKARYFARDFHKIKIYFDGDCRFCEKMVLILREFFLFSNVEINPTQSSEEINRAMLTENSWVVENAEGRRFYHFEGMLEVMKNSPLLKMFVPLLSRPFFFGLFTNLYKWVANNRQLLGRYSQFLDIRPDKKDIPWIRWAYQLAGAFFLVTLIMWNAVTVKKWHITAPFFQNVTRYIHLYQEWNMFAPFPKMDNVWVEVPAVLSDGSHIELITRDTDIYSVKDKAFTEVMPNEHWRKFYLNLSDRTDYARYYGGYLCREWNERRVNIKPNTTLRKMEVIVYSQPNLPNNQKGGISVKLSWKHWCFDDDFKKEKADAEKMPTSP